MLFATEFARLCISSSIRHSRRADLLKPGSADVEDALCRVEVALSASCLLASLDRHNGKVHDVTFAQVFACMLYVDTDSSLYYHMLEALLRRPTCHQGPVHAGDAGDMWARLHRAAVELRNVQLPAQHWHTRRSGDANAPLQGLFADVAF